MPISIDDVALISKKDLARLTSTVEDLLSSLQALAGDAAPAKVRRGRPPKNGRRRGRPPGSGKKAGAKKGGKRAPRGALEAEIKKALRGRKEARLVDIRDNVMESPHFSGHDPKTLYTMITNKTSKMKEVKKSGKGYALKG